VVRRTDAEKRDRVAVWAREYRARRKNDPVRLEKMRAQEKKYKKTMRDKINARRRAYFATDNGKSNRRDHMRSLLLSHPDYLFNRNLVKKFGITAAQYVEMADAQNWVCAICKKPERAIRKGQVMRLAVDHHHETGVVRALLCSHCNRGIGFFDGDPSVMMAAVKYLDGHGLFAKENRPRSKTSLPNGSASNIGTVVLHTKPGE